MIGFERTRSFATLIKGKLNHAGLDLTSTQQDRYNTIRRNWNFYEGYHWEELPETDGVELTLNYCRAFVNKYVSFELGNGFSFNTHEKMKDKAITPEGKSSFDYLESVWKDNDKDLLINEFGQMKSVTGEAWIHVHYAPPGSFSDPFGIYTGGRIELLLLPTSAVYPDWNPHKRGELRSLLITYQYQKVTRNELTGGVSEKFALYRQIWTNDEIIVRDDGEEKRYVNKYGTIPIIPIKNLCIAGREEGQSDLDDLIPVNVELNQKSSDVSEIIDYHAAPITVVVGAKIGNLEKGANKVWGGLPKGASVSNLTMQSELTASTNYIAGLKKSMSEIGALPESALGGAQHISNTSGVALHIAQGPLIDITRNKRNATKRGVELINRMILYVSLLEGLITRPAGVTNEEFFFTDVKIPETLPKDMLLELQQISLEMKLGLENRYGAMQRLNRDDIEKKLEAVDEEMKARPELYFGEQANSQSGFLNGEGESAGGMSLKPDGEDRGDE